MQCLVPGKPSAVICCFVPTSTEAESQVLRGDPVLFSPSMCHLASPSTRVPWVWRAPGIMPLYMPAGDIQPRERLVSRRPRDWLAAASSAENSSVPGTVGNGVCGSGQVTCYRNDRAAVWREPVAGCRAQEQVLGVDGGAAGSRDPPGRTGSQVWALGCGMGPGTGAPQRYLRRQGEDWES